MKSLITSVFFLFFMTSAVQAQNFVDRFNFLIGGGYEVQRTNTNINNHFAWMYLDYHIIKGPNWMFGPYVLLGTSGSRNNISRYEGSGKEIGLGGTLGLWTELSRRYNSYSSFALGVRYYTDAGESKLRYGTYKGDQEDVVLVSELAFNAIRKNEISWFPRTRIALSYQVPLNSSKEATWNSSAIPAEIWQREAGKLEIKQNIYSFPVSTYLAAPKIVAEYLRTRGQNFYGLGGGVALHERGRDSFLEITMSYIYDEKFQKDIISWELIFNVSQLF